MLELESIHIDPLSYDVKPRGDSQRLDLENAVLMQELMAMKVWGRGRVRELGSRVLHCHREEERKAPETGQLMRRSRPFLLSSLSPGELQRLVVDKDRQFPCQGLPPLGRACSWRGELASSFPRRSHLRPLQAGAASEASEQGKAQGGAWMRAVS